MHSVFSIGVSFGILFAAVGMSFAYVSGNPVEVNLGRPWVGVEEGTNVDAAIAEAMRLQEARGILIITITEGSPADKAGLRQGDEIAEIENERIRIGGDVIIGINGRQVANNADAEAALAGKMIGDSVKFTVIRNGSTQEFSVVLEELPAERQP